jgi:O-antigen ligase
MFGLLVATGSRLAMLTFAIAFVAEIVLLKTRNYYFRIMALFAGIALFFFIWQLAMDNEILRSRLLLSLHEGQLSDRDVIWKNILPIIRENPFFGVGQTGYAAFCMKEFGRYVSPHSVVMELAVFSGFTGLILYFIFLYRVFRMAYLSYKIHGFLLPVLLCLIVTGLLLGSHMLELKLGWAILAYVTCSAAYCSKTDRMAEVCYH